MDCPYCGAENPDGSGYCNLCLKRFDAPPFAPAASQAGRAGRENGPAAGPDQEFTLSGEPDDYQGAPRYDPSFFDPGYGHREPVDEFSTGSGSAPTGDDFAEPPADGPVAEPMPPEAEKTPE